MIGVDWGTSSLRAYRLDPQGRVLERRETARGILHVAGGEFPRVLAEVLSDWLEQEHEILVSGMAGSRQGWVEVPYRDCPAGVAELAESLVSVDFMPGRRVRIVPGLSCLDASGVVDVMRGEETQILGVLDHLPAQASVCLPGTHSKWVQLVGGRILGFDTHMTGEVFSVLRQHSLLGRMMTAVPVAEDAFRQGVRRAWEAGGLLHHLFGVRSRGLLGLLSAEESGAYLSGILIGHEVTGRPPLSGPIYLLGNPDLVGLYAWALDEAGVHAQVLPSDAAALGHHRLAQGA